MSGSLPSGLSHNTRNTMLYTDAISAVWSWWDLIADPSYAIREDLDIWNTAQRDPKVYQGIQQRLNAIAGRQWRVMPRDNTKAPQAKTKAAIVDAILRRIPHFQDARRRLAQSVFRGQASELICGRREFLALNSQPAMNWWVCTGLEHVDPRRFVIRPIRENREDGTRKIRGQLYMSVVPTYQAVPRHTMGKQGKDREQLWYGRYVPVDHPEWFVRIVYDDEEARLGFGRGVLDAIYFFLWVKSIVMREGLQGLERFVHGVPIVTLDPSKRGATDQASETIRDTALAKIKVMRSGHAFALNAGETLQWAEPGGVGQQMVMGWLEYIDRSLMAVITGSNLKSSGGDPGSAGGYASDQVGADVQDSVVQYDRDKIDEDLSLDLIGLICKLNRQNFETLGKMIGQPGLADEPNPVFTTVVKRHADPMTSIQRLQIASQIDGFDVLKSEMYEEQGWSMPEDDDDVFEGKSPQDPQAMPVGPDGMPLPQTDEDAQAEEDEENWPEGPPEDKETLFGGGSPEDDLGLFEVAPEVVDETGFPSIAPDFGTETGAEEGLVINPPGQSNLYTGTISGTWAPASSGISDDQLKRVLRELMAEKGVTSPLDAIALGAEDVKPDRTDIPEVQHDISPSPFPGGTDATSGKRISVSEASGSGVEDRTPTTDASQIQSPADVGQPAGDMGTGSGTAKPSITPPGPLPPNNEPKQATVRRAPDVKGTTKVPASETAAKVPGPKWDASPSTHPITKDDARVTSTSKNPDMRNAIEKKKKGKQ